MYKILSILFSVSIKTFREGDANVISLKPSGKDEENSWIRRVLRVHREVYEHTIRMEEEVNILGRNSWSRRGSLKLY